MGLVRYRITDLTILLVIMCVIEALSIVVLKRFGSQFVLSVIVPITLIVYMRWSGYGLIHAFAGGILYSVVIHWYNGALTFSSVARDATIYCVGYLCTAAALLLFIKGKDKVNKSRWLTALYAFIAFAAMCIGRAVTATVFGEDFFGVLLGYLTRESLNFVFTVIVLWIARRQNGFFTDQKEYFFSVRK